MGVLNAQQRRDYEEAGYLLVSGMISVNIAARAEAAMWRIMGMDRDDSATWSRRPEGVAYFQPERGLSVHNGLQDSELLACETPAYLKATAELLGEELVHPPEAVHTQNKVPISAEWTWPSPHIDGIPKEHMHRTFPGPYRIASLVFLSDVAPGGGGTVVWPGSHRKIRALAESDSEKYAYLYNFNRDIPSLDLGEPVELTPRCGDVLFFQHLFGHNGTANIGDRPRWMMRYFCSCPACFKQWKKTDQWGLWTP